MGYRIAVDTGGTFTDVCLYDEATRTVAVTKVSSTPADPGAAVVEGVKKILLSADGALDETAFGSVSYFAHGTTVATNALLQEKGARTGLITTRGFKDLLEIARQKRPGLYDLFGVKPTPLVSRDLRLEVDERVRFDGSIETELDAEDVRLQARALKAAGVTAVAVCFLYSYLVPDHERKVKEILAEELPDAFLSVSHEVLPQFREYERLSTVVINAFIGPTMHGYLTRLESRLREEGLRPKAHVTQSNGGIMSFTAAAGLPVRTVLSGPSTGVVGSAEVCRASGIEDIITFDMGGTSSDVALVAGGRPVETNGMELDGRPVQAPMLDINTVGAGGGSIAWIDEGGHLKVGPQSAGAVPGPACYGLGNTAPTVTDANVVLGVLNQSHLLGGTMPIDASLSYQAVAALGERLGLSPEDTAQGIISVVTANMARAIRVISVQRGYDPSDYALVSFGGAGPLHSARLAQELNMRRTVIPHSPGATSAMGMLMADLKTESSVTRVVRLTIEAIPVVRELLRDLEASVVGWFEEENVALADRSVSRILEVRYVGQNYEMAVEVPDADDPQLWLGSVRAQFDALHEQRYGYHMDDAAIEVVTLRVGGTGAVPHAEFPARPIVGTDPSPAVIGERDIYLPEFGQRRTSPVYQRELLPAGAIIDGPAVIEQYDTTTFLVPGESARVDERLLIVTELGAPGSGATRTEENA
ncbi:hydantoinase/oxoprolinase family protein [Microbacterium tumbae]